MSSNGFVSIILIKTLKSLTETVTCVFTGHLLNIGINNRFRSLMRGQKKAKQ